MRPELDLSGTPEVVAVGLHDTASAVVRVPADSELAYISCGTWSLVGVERDAPVLIEATRQASFTNEADVDRTVRYVRNVMGLWPRQESLRTWNRQDLTALRAAAAPEPALAAVVDLDDPVFPPAGDVPADRRSLPAHRAAGRWTPTAVVRCILDSLPLAHRRAVHQVQHLSRRHVHPVHVVGGVRPQRPDLPAHRGGLRPAGAGRPGSRPPRWETSLVQARGVCAWSTAHAQRGRQIRAYGGTCRKPGPVASRSESGRGPLAVTGRAGTPATPRRSAAARPYYAHTPHRLSGRKFSTTSSLVARVSEE